MTTDAEGTKSPLTMPGCDQLGELPSQLASAVCDVTEKTPCSITDSVVGGKKHTLNVSM